MVSLDLDGSGLYQPLALVGVDQCFVSSDTGGSGFVVGVNRT